MLTREDEMILGITRRAKRPTAVSRALKAISDEVFIGRESWPVKRDGEQPRYRITVAADRYTRERAYALACRVYRRSGYTTDEQRLCVAPYDACAQTLTLLAQDAKGNDCATISVVFDTNASLPCDEIYHPEVSALRASGYRLAEVTRLAIDESCDGARELLLHLFDQCYIFARFVRGCSDLIVEVNPRHVAYYQRLLRFEIAGPERACSRVQGAPAILLRLDLAQIEATVKGAGCTDGRDVTGRRLHPYPYSLQEEKAVAEFLVRTHRAMTRDEKRYFGLDAPAVTVPAAESNGAIAAVGGVR